VSTTDTLEDPCLGRTQTEDYGGRKSSPPLSQVLMQPARLPTLYHSSSVGIFLSSFPLHSVHLLALSTPDRTLLAATARTTRHLCIFPEHPHCQPLKRGGAVPCLPQLSSLLSAHPSPRRLPVSDCRLLSAYDTERERERGDSDLGPNHQTSPNAAAHPPAVGHLESAF
jgi:hypothetical protein